MYDKLIKSLKEDAYNIKETHPRVRMGILRAIMIIEEQIIDTNKEKELCEYFLERFKRVYPEYHEDIVQEYYDLHLKDPQ